MRQPKSPSRQPVINRLSRADGHLRAVITMLRTDQPSTAIAQQIRAIEVALASAKQEFVHEHMQHCIERRDLSGEAFRELKQLARFL